MLRADDTTCLTTNRPCYCRGSLGNTLADKFEVTSSGSGDYWVMDDLRIEAVPIPAAVWLG